MGLPPAGVAIPGGAANPTDQAILDEMTDKQKDNYRIQYLSALKEHKAALREIFKHILNERLSDGLKIAINN